MTLYQDKTNVYRDKYNYINEKLDEYEDKEEIIKPNLIRIIILTEETKKYLSSHPNDYIKVFKTLKEGIDYTIEIEVPKIKPPIEYHWKETSRIFANNFFKHRNKKYLK